MMTAKKNHVQNKKSNSSCCLRALVILWILFGIFIVSVDVFLLFSGLPEDKSSILTSPKDNKDVSLSGESEISDGGENNPAAQLVRDEVLDNPDAVADLLRTAGAEVDARSLAKLPTFRQVIEQYGSEPVILGLERCAEFRQAVPAVRRMLAPSGMFSTGTNLVTQLLKKNCYIPERAAAVEGGLEKATKEELGMRWQVPWGKHTPVSYKEKHATRQAQEINKDDVLPVVSIRNPWRWMQSMCRNSYTAHWKHHRICPHLTTMPEDKSGDHPESNATDFAWNPVSVKYGVGSENYTSLVHLWVDWYAEYMAETRYPFLVIRMEDLVFFTQETITQVCTCAGGLIRADQPFQYVLESAKKDSPGHDTSTGLTEAWIKYSQRLQPQAGFVTEDYRAALHALNQDKNHLMEKFQYHNPSHD